jgi:hypothetical protein
VSAPTETPPWPAPDPATRASGGSPAAPDRAGRTDRGGILALIGCLLLVAALSLPLQRWEEDAPVDYVDAGVQVLASARRYDAQVQRVVVTRAVLGSYGDPITTVHRYVVVDLEVRVKQSTQSFDKIRLVTQSGQRYEPRAEFDRLESCSPGFTAYGQVVFEVPADRLAGATLVLGPETGTYRVYDTALRFDLGLVPESATVAQVDLAEGRQEVTR